MQKFPNAFPFGQWRRWFETILSSVKQAACVGPTKCCPWHCCFILRTVLALYLNFMEYKPWIFMLDSLGLWVYGLKKWLNTVPPPAGSVRVVSVWGHLLFDRFIRDVQQGGWSSPVPFLLPSCLSTSFGVISETVTPISRGSNSFSVGVSYSTAVLLWWCHLPSMGKSQLPAASTFQEKLILKTLKHACIECACLIKRNCKVNQWAVGKHLAEICVLKLV